MMGCWLKQWLDRLCWCEIALCLGLQVWIVFKGIRASRDIDSRLSFASLQWNYWVHQLFWLLSIDRNCDYIKPLFQDWRGKSCSKPQKNTIQLCDRLTFSLEEPLKSGQKAIFEERGIDCHVCFLSRCELTKSLSRSNSGDSKLDWVPGIRINLIRLIQMLNTIYT
jgi:hypothetical protein